MRGCGYCITCIFTEIHVLLSYIVLALMILFLIITVHRESNYWKLHSVEYCITLLVNWSPARSSENWTVCDEGRNHSCTYAVVFDFSAETSRWWYAFLLCQRYVRYAHVDLVTGMRQKSRGFTSTLLLTELVLKYFKHKVLNNGVLVWVSKKIKACADLPGPNRLEFHRNKLTKYVS